MSGGYHLPYLSGCVEAVVLNKAGVSTERGGVGKGASSYFDAPPPSHAVRRLCGPGAARGE